jgi:hypothetical protein
MNATIYDVNDVCLGFPYRDRLMQKGFFFSGGSNPPRTGPFPQLIQPFEGVGLTLISAFNKLISYAKNHSLEFGRHGQFAPHGEPGFGAHHPWLRQ